MACDIEFVLKHQSPSTLPAFAAVTRTRAYKRKTTQRNLFSFLPPPSRPRPRPALFLLAVGRDDGELSLGHIYFQILPRERIPFWHKSGTTRTSCERDI